MENMGTVLVDVNTFNILGIDIARNIGTLVHDQHRLSMRVGFMGKDCSI